MIRFDGLDQAIEDIWHSMGHATPVGNHGNPKRVIEKALCSQQIGRAHV